MKKYKKTVFVGISGGVDSAVSAALLKQKGYDVVGVFMRTWHPDFLECLEEEERRDAIRVAAHLEIPFLTFDLEEVYKKEVADYMISEYATGRTPNPDVMCNKEVKFGAFFRKSIKLGADFVATGHYARLGYGLCEGVHDQGVRPPVGGRTPKHSVQLNCEPNAQSLPHPKPFSCLGEWVHGSPPLLTGEGGRGVRLRKDEFHNLKLLKSPDPTKDQSYFLWTLRQSQLKKIIFPIGHLNKKQVRVLAKKFLLPVAEKKDSQGICFLGKLDLKDFLKHYIKQKNGTVILPNGSVIGRHIGANFYTLGERHGFVITDKNLRNAPYYIVAKDFKKNTITVSQDKDKYLQENTKILCHYFLEKTNWLIKPKSDKEYTAQIRYHGELINCHININTQNRTKANIYFSQPVIVAPGQSCVIYDNDILLGGGVIV